jgi:uncharacterized Zn-binding protein involved in type VI secretion
MGVPAVVLGDRVTGTCPGHLVPGPAGAPRPAGPLPFSAPLTLQLVPTVLIASKPAAVVGSQGLNTPPHAGLHGADPFMAPPTQIGRVVMGSTTVMLGGKPAAKTGSNCQLCSTPGTVTGSATTVLIGG